MPPKETDHLLPLTAASTTLVIADNNNSNEHQPLANAIWALANDNEIHAVRTGAQLLYLYCVNVSSHPRVPRYRKIFTSNESFQSNVAPLKGAQALLEAVGFVQMDNVSGKPAADYWEWLPPSIHQNSCGDDDDNADNGSTLNQFAPSPKHAWLGDSEEFYLQRLKMAAAALSLIKSPTFGKDCQHELWEIFGLQPSSLGAYAADVAPSNYHSVSVEELSVTTPDRSGISFLDDDMHGDMNFTPTINGHHSSGASFQTPDAGAVLSPPTTKKQLSLSSDFPSLDNPLLEHDILSPPKLNVLHEGDSCEASELSLVGVGTNPAATGNSAETAMWK